MIEHTTEVYTQDRLTNEYPLKKNLNTKVCAKYLLTLSLKIWSLHQLNQDHLQCLIKYTYLCPITDLLDGTLKERQANTLFRGSTANDSYVSVLEKRTIVCSVEN